MIKKKATNRATRATYISKSERYNVLSTLFAGGHIKSFKDIFTHVPPTEVRNKIGMSDSAFKKYLHKPKKFKVEQIEKMGKIFNIDFKELLLLAAGIKNK